MNENKLKCFLDVPSGEYHEAAKRGQFLSSHLLGDFRKSPRLYRKKLSGEIEREDTSALLIGRAVHVLVLEGRARFDEEFLVSDGPINQKTGEVFGKLTKAYREWAACQRLPVVSGADFNFMTKLQQSVWTHPIASVLLDEGIAEQTVRAKYCAEPCQARMDWFRKDYEGMPAICDLKTCDTLDYFENDARRYGYIHQMAFYKAVLETASCGDVTPDCYLIAVEKREPYRCGVWKLTTGFLESCARANEKCIEELHECRRSNQWPTRTEDLRYLDL